MVLTAGIVLAAGQSRRMGKDKISLNLEGIPLGLYAVNAALGSNLDVVIVVVRPNDPLEWLMHSRAGKLIVIACADAEQEMSSSLRCGLKAASDMNADSACILLADQPLVQIEHINKLISAFMSSPDLHYVSAREGDLDKPPLLLSSRIFSAVSALEGDAGARSMIRNSSCRGKHITLSSEAFYDADTPEAFAYISDYMRSR